MTRTRRQRGQTAVETVLMVPLLLLLFFLIFEIGRVFGSWLMITNSAREGARLAVVETFNPQADSIDRVRARVQQTSQFLTVNTASCSGSYDSCVDVAPPPTPGCGCEQMVTVVVRYRVYTLMPINGNIPFLGEFNYPGFVEVVGLSTMRWE
jgi:Flp pilus assembly protein TadG